MSEIKRTVESGKFQRTPGKFLEQVLKGDTIIITRHKRPIAVLRPVEQSEEEPTGEEKEHEE